MTSQSIADDVTMTRQLWRDHVSSDIQLVRYRFYSRRYSRSVVKKETFRQFKIIIIQYVQMVSTCSINVNWSRQFVNRKAICAHTSCGLNEFSRLPSYISNILLSLRFVLISRQWCDMQIISKDTIQRKSSSDKYIWCLEITENNFFGNQTVISLWL